MNYEARPTEYKGITFRSKSEAIVARGFDIAGALWKYEPEILDANGENIFKDGYKPDFFVVHGNGNGLMQYYVEYKPKEPTSVYVKELYERFIKLNKVHCVAFNVILCGSPFLDKDGCILSIYRDNKGVCQLFNPYIEDVDTDFMYSHWDEAKKYRFDLINN